jgi:tetratricopeptide (TPR) repeat protein
MEPAPVAKKKRKKTRPKQPRGKSVQGLPDRRAMEAVLHQVLASFPGNEAEDTPLARAQALIHQAFAEPDEQRRVQLARQALALCPDCADAYVLLAEHVPNRKEALALYEQGTAAGERALGADAFQRDVGKFWGLLATRPYMRARLGFAHSLWTAGRRDEAVQHLQDMLRLNPGDNQGIRYTLAGFLLSLDRDDDLARLLEQYADEASATWAFTQALLTFRRHGDTLEARQLLKKAKKANKHIPDYLLGRKQPPAVEPEGYSPGRDSEAVMYFGGFMAAWRYTPGALAWLRQHDEQTRKRKAAAAPHLRGPLGFIKKWLTERLPQQDDVWQADFCQLPSPVVIAGDRVRPWAILVTNRTQDLVLGHQLVEEEPPPALVWDTVVQAMQHPVIGDPQRPRTLQIRSSPAWASLRPHFAEIGIELVVLDELDQLSAVLQGLNEHIGGKPRPGLIEIPGITPAQIGAFYDAAATFFEQAPWQQVGYESALKIECAKFQSGPWYAAIMGQSGVTTGLALYDDLSALQQVWRSPSDDRDSMRKDTATTVTFGDDLDIALSDLAAAKQYGWKVARPDAYPEIFRKEPGMTLRPPLAWELELMTTCLRAVPGFAVRRRQDDPAREEVAVPTASGSLALALSWIVDS